MKIHISDISALLPTEMPEVMEDRELSEKIKADVFQKIGIEQKKSKVRKPLRIVLIAAAITALLTVTGLAASTFTMDNKEVQEGEKVSGVHDFWNSDNNTWEEVELEYPHAGMTFQFDGPDIKPNFPELRANWLPCMPNQAHICGEEASDDIDKLEYTKTFGGIKMKTWTGSMRYDPTIQDGRYIPGDDGDILYSVGVHQPLDYMTYVLEGDVTVTKEEDWENWHVIMLSSNYKKLCGYDHIINYVYMFDEATGYFVDVAGAADLETLEKIARNLEIRESDIPYPEPPAEEPKAQICIMDLGRG